MIARQGAALIRDESMYVEASIWWAAICTMTVYSSAVPSKEEDKGKLIEKPVVPQCLLTLCHHVQSRDEPLGEQDYRRSVCSKLEFSGRGQRGYSYQFVRDFTSTKSKEFVTSTVRLVNNARRFRRQVVVADDRSDET